MGIAFIMYTDEYDAWMPVYYDPRWYVSLDRYMNKESLFKCPSHFNSYYHKYWDGHKQVHYYVTYGYNFANLGNLDFGPPKTPIYYRLTTVKNPSHTIVIGDRTEAHDNYIITPTPDHIGSLHSGGANILFADGHVKWFPHDTIFNSDWWDRN